MNDEKKTEKKTFKERFAEKKAKAKAWLEENKETIGISIPIAGAFVLGVVSHILYDDMKNGNKSVAWYDHYSGKDGCPEIVTYTKTPTIRDIKRGKYDSAFTGMTFDEDEVERIDDKFGWEKG